MCKKECYYYNEVQDMGAHIPTCTRQDNLGVCPCDDCTNYILAADVQPLSVVAEHIKERLYETAFNTNEPIARDAIADMAGRIDFWIDELKDGDTE